MPTMAINETLMPLKGDPLVSPRASESGVHRTSAPNSDGQHASAWISESTTPMTTRPHFERQHSASPPTIRRIRSRSLAAEVEAYGAEAYNYRHPSLLLPDLEHLPKVQFQPLDTPETSQGDSVIKEEPVKNPLYICILYGLINASIVLPVLMSFGSIIYRDQAFGPYMPSLIKLTLVSGIVHQLCFSTLSSLPFAVGQVQDAGLIFLSSMASYMVEHCKSRGYNDDVLLATATVGLGLCTALLGAGLVLVGRLRLAQYVQLLPTSVVGGYLAFIGWFCGVSGVGIMAGDSQLTLGLVQENWAFVAPGVLGGILIYASVRTLRHMAVLPSCICFLMLLFYLILWWQGATIEEVTQLGWIRQMDPPPAWYHTWDYVRVDKVAWGVLPNLVLTELSMIFVVALSSSLDIAAIELELRRPLDYNGELSMIGVSNIISGLCAGYTGSYIFSQSLFSLRAGIRSRIAGYALAGAQLIVLLLPFPILSFVPNFFFGSMLSMICVDLMFEWLWHVRHRLPPAEYVICLATFVLIQLMGVEYGIFAGVLLYLGAGKLGFHVGPKKEEPAEDNSSEPNNAISLHTNGKESYGTL